MPSNFQNLKSDFQVILNQNRQTFLQPISGIFIIGTVVQTSRPELKRQVFEDYPFF